MDFYPVGFAFCTLVQFLAGFCSPCFRMSPKRKRPTKAPARYADDVARPPRKQARSVVGDVSTEGTPTVSIPAPMPSPGVSDLSAQMVSMKTDMASLREVVLGFAPATASGNRIPAAAGSVTPAAAGSTLPAATGSAIPLDGSLAGDLGETLPSYPKNLNGFAAVPLGSLVDQIIKEKIWSDQYVNIALLISDSVPETSVLTSGQPFFFTQPPTLKNIANIELMVGGANLLQDWLCVVGSPTFAV